MEVRSLARLTRLLWTLSMRRKTKKTLSKKWLLYLSKFLKVSWFSSSKAIKTKVSSPKCWRDQLKVWKSITLSPAVMGNHLIQITNRKCWWPTSGRRVSSSRTKFNSNKRSKGNFPRIEWPRRQKSWRLTLSTRKLEKFLKFLGKWETSKGDLPIAKKSLKVTPKIRKSLHFLHN